MKNIRIRLNFNELKFCFQYNINFRLKDLIYFSSSIMKFKRIYIFLLITQFFLNGCKLDHTSELEDIDFRQEMRNFVIGLSDEAHTLNPNFIVIPQNGQELVTDSGYSDGIPQNDYIQSIDATGREDLYYGYTGDNILTPQEENTYMLSLCQLCEQHQVEVLTIDYCSSHDKMDHSYMQNQNHGFISFAANDRNLRNIPDYPTQPFQVHSNDITHISQAKNFLYLINSENYNTKQDFIDAVKQTNYDVIIMDLYHFEESFTILEINQLKTKQNGGQRLVICYMSIGEAEDYRYYWQNSWNTNKPEWLEPENPNWPGNYKVRYWMQDWKNIIYGNENAYLKKVLNAGFDGVYLDIIDAFDYFEQNYTN
jgi:cysteinyl-tRNA synthetase